jgi:muramoyltetrapeptide carboxypeptidase LdcA involved in peptidoglycan recycling
MNFAITCSTLCPRVVTLHNVIDHIYYSQDIPWYQQLNFAHIQNKPYH